MELRPPICRLDGMSGRPTGGKGLNREGDLVEAWPHRCPQISRSPRYVKSGKFQRGSRDLGPTMSNPGLKQKNTSVRTMFPYSCFWGIPPGGANPALCYSMGLRAARCQRHHKNVQDGHPWCGWVDNCLNHGLEWGPKVRLLAKRARPIRSWPGDTLTASYGPMPSHSSVFAPHLF